MLNYYKSELVRIIAYLGFHPFVLHFLQPLLLVIRIYYSEFLSVVESTPRNTKDKLYPEC